MFDFFITESGYVYLRCEGFNIECYGQVGFYRANNALLNRGDFPVAGKRSLLSHPTMAASDALSA